MKHRRSIRILSALLALTLLLAIVPQRTLAADAAETSGKCGDNLTWSFDEATCTLTISGYGTMDDYQYSSSSSDDEGTMTISTTIPWFDYAEQITALRLPENLLSIGANAFRSCSKLQQVVVPNSVTEIGKNAFDECSSLAQITLPETDCTIEEYAFSGCKRLKSIRIPYGTTEIFEGTFESCTDLEDIMIPASVKYIGFHAISDCDSLQTISLPDSLRVIGDSAFSGCCNLQSITIPNSVKEIETAAFSWCTSLQSVILPDGLSHIGMSLFSGCTSLRDVEIPDSVTSISCTAFSDTLIYNDPGCWDNGLLYLDGWVIDSIAQIDSADVRPGTIGIADQVFFMNTELTNVTLPDRLLFIGESAFKECTGIQEITIPDSVISIGDYAFSYCSNLKRIQLPANLRLINYELFFECSELAEIVLPDDLETIFDAAFSGTAFSNDPDNWADGLLYLGNWLIDSDPEIISAEVRPGTWGISTAAFYHREKLTRVTLPDSLRRIDYAAFASCISLTEIAIPDSVTTIAEQTFYNCTKLARISLPKSVNKIELFAFDNTAYYNDDNNWSDGLLYLGNWLINCDAIENATLRPDTFGLADFAFAWNNQLRNVSLPDGLRFIGDNAFFACKNLPCIVIPETVQRIGDRAFDSCDNLKDVMILSKDCSIENDSPIYCTFGDPDTTALIGYPGSSTAIYAGAYGLRFQDIADRPFIDVSESAYYAKPVAWAVEHDVTNGTSPQSFSPEATCTRAQMVTLLWRAKGEPEPAIDQNPFKDVAEGQYYYKAVLWAAEQGITTGTSADRFSPNSACTRGQVVTFLWRAMGKPAPGSITSPFKDVNPGEYYGQAVLWAVEKGVTKGTAADRFSPASTCTRGQIVTFLYRAIA